MKRTVTILGATGSVGKSSLAAVTAQPELFSVFALTAFHQGDVLFDQCLQVKPRYAVLVDPMGAKALQEKVRAAALPTEVLSGEEALSFVSSHSDCDVVIAAIVGVAGLAPNLAAVRAGKHVLLANKESFVVCGRLFQQISAQSGATLLPIDSEHNGLFQCLPRGRTDPSVRRLILTSSGGPFRTRALDTLGKVTPEEACAHPNWSMGKQISVASATMMNKALEVIEARWLFDVSPRKIEVLIHPEQAIHALVEYSDGALLAHLSVPDMRHPISHALNWPKRAHHHWGTLDLAALGQLHFMAVDEQRFPLVRAAYDVLEGHANASIYFNAVNEVAIASFLREEIPFTAIHKIVLDGLAHDFGQAYTDLDDVLEHDQRARALALTMVQKKAKCFVSAG